MRANQIFLESTLGAASNGYVWTLIDSSTGEGAWMAGGGATAWGGITGTLSDQTDLQTALDGKFDDPTGTTLQYIRGNGTLFAMPITIQNTTSLFSTGLSGTGSGSSATNAIFLGQGAGESATSANQSIFLGLNAGNTASSASVSTFIGQSSGSLATNATQSNFVGGNAGFQATNAQHSNFYGYRAGAQATSAQFSNFVGHGAGDNATGATQSNFFGRNAGNYAANSSGSIFIGDSAGKYLDTTVDLGSPNAANSIFIGQNAGYFAADTGLDNTSAPDDYSILIGKNTSTGGFENSIAIGSSAVNTASNEFMIGSTTRRIEDLVFNGGTGNTCSINAGTGITCSSDERLKTNIEDLETDTLDKVLTLRTVRYNWSSDPDGNEMVGFIAQNLQEQFPQLISENIDGMLSVNYAQMTPILVEAIREINDKIVDIGDIETENSWRSALIEWFASATNGIQEFFARRITTKEICVANDEGETTCLTKSQIDAIIDLGNISTPANDVSEETEGTQQETADPADEEEVVDTEEDTEAQPEAEAEQSDESGSETSDTAPASEESAADSPAETPAQ